MEQQPNRKSEVRSINPAISNQENTAGNGQKSFKKNNLYNVIFEPFPKIGQRIKKEKDKNVILCPKTGYTLYDDKSNYPSIFENVFYVLVVTGKFKFTFEVKNKNKITNDPRYRWNNADICGVLKCFCSPDDRRIILPSGIHDYMLEYKEEIYAKIKHCCTPEEFRELTSKIFIRLCKEQGFSACKAGIMGNLVDFYQKYFQKKKWQVLYG